MMRTLTLSAMALALTVAAGAAQAGSYYLPYNKIEGIGNLHLPQHVKVYPPYILVKPHLHIEHGVEFGQYNTGDTVSKQGLITKGPKKVTGTSAAIGNTANVDVKGGVFVEGNQKNYASELSKQGALVLGAKKVELTSAAIGNATNVTTTGDAVVDMNQINSYGRMDSFQISGVFSPYGHGLGNGRDHLGCHRQHALGRLRQARRGPGFFASAQHERRDVHQPRRRRRQVQERRDHVCRHRQRPEHHQQVIRASTDRTLSLRRRDVAMIWGWCNATPFFL